MNHDKDKDFDQLLRSKLDQYRPEVSPSIWENIQHELDNQPVSKSNKTRGFLRYSRAIAAAIVLVGLTFIVRMSQQEEVLYLQAADVPGTTNNSDEEFNRFGTPPGITPKDKISPERKLSDDLKTISRVLAATLEKTERKANNSNSRETVSEPGPDQLMARIHPLIEEEPIVVAQVLKPQLALQPQTHLEEITDELAPAPITVATIDHVEDHTTVRERQSFGVGRILNLMVAQIDRREEKFIHFTNDEEGSLKIEFNSAQIKRN